MAAVITVSKRHIDTLIEAHLHGSSYKCFDSLKVVIYRVFNILYLTAVTELPEAVLKVLLFYRSDILGHMAMEGVGHILSVRNILHYTVFLTELLYLKTAQALCRSPLYGIEMAVLLLELIDLLVYI